MAAPFRPVSSPLRLIRPRRPQICPQCLWHRSLGTSAILLSGHNKWSKIKHGKGVADAKKSAERAVFATQLAIYSRLFGPDPKLNGQLASAIAAAKKAGMPKDRIEVAINRGQGKSTTGAQLESVMMEVMAPGSVAMVLAIETDNRNRVLQHLNTVVKKHDFRVTPTTYLFTKMGRTVLKPKDAGESDFDDVLMQAIEAGAEDVESEDGNIIVWTQPNTTHQAAQALSAAIGADILSSDIIWSPNDKVVLDEQDAASKLADFLAAIRENEDLQAVYANAEKGSISDEIWDRIEENLD